MESFVIKGKASTVFRLLKLMAWAEKEELKRAKKMMPARRTA